MEFKDILKVLLEERDLKAIDLCRLTGIKSSLMSNYTTGKKSPALTNAKLIAEALGVTLDELAGRQYSDNKDLTPEIKEIIKKYTAIDQEDQECFKALLDIKYRQKLDAISPCKTG
jgi:transcriptional regulator with XRE-family HTH domain